MNILFNKFNFVERSGFTLSSAVAAPCTIGLLITCHVADGPSLTQPGPNRWVVHFFPAWVDYIPNPSSP